MTTRSRTYVITEAGRRAWESQDEAMPAEYRRILWLIESEAHTDVLRGCLREYPDRLLFEWLDELEELGLVESRLAVIDYGLDLTSPPATLPPLPIEDTARIDREMIAVGAALVRGGAYLSEPRLLNREPLAKPVEQTDILIVEDDPDARALADLRMSLAGYSVRVADSVNALLHSLLDPGTPDLLILDVMLPDGDGFNVLAKLRRHPLYCLLPVVMLTAKDSSEDIRKGLILGADGYVTKPYSKNVIADTVRRVLKQGEWIRLR
jgi:CheY-like chemotaxis protein